jgi:serine/threonine protein kinase
MASKVLKERYVVQKQLSKNAGRRTFMARDLQTQELVAIKLLIFGEDVCWDDLKLFEREAQTLQQLSHPAIPHYLDYFDVDVPTGKGFALVQSYIPAKSLEQWLKSGRTFSESEVKQLAKSLLKILDYLHKQQPPVIHRDIKPSNILLANRSGDSVGDVYLVDFGSVQTLAARKGGTITVVGTYGYMPPEQFGGRNVPASDIYSLGATLIYLVTGKHPAELSQGNSQIEFESKVSLNPDLIAWLKWMTQSSLKRRLASAKEALEALENPKHKTDISAVRQQPFGSRIELKKDGENVEILIPPKRLGLFVLPCIWRILTFLSFPAIFMLVSIFSPGGGIFSLFSLFFIGIISFIVFLEARETFFISTRINIDRKQISVTYLWPWYKSRVALLQEKSIMNEIKYIRDSSASAGPDQYYIHEMSRLTLPEIEWLANEIKALSGGKIIVAFTNKEYMNRELLR